MNQEASSIGCRNIAMATGLILSIAIVFMVAGLAMTNQESCEGLCQTVGLTLLYAGGPISALFGVFSGWVIVAWPLEITLWVVVGFASAKWAETRGRGVLGVAVTVLAIALIYGLVLSQFVEIAV